MALWLWEKIVGSAVGAVCLPAEKLPRSARWPVERSTGESGIPSWKGLRARFSPAASAARICCWRVLSAAIDGGYFEGLNSERVIAWWVAGSLSL